MTTKKQNVEFGLVASLAVLVVSIHYKVNLNVVVVVTLLASLLMPKLYAPFAWLWFWMGKALGIVMSKVVLSLIFFLIVTPVGMMRRALGKDNLHIGHSKRQKNFFEKQKHTYIPEDMEKQF